MKTSSKVTKGFSPILYPFLFLGVIQRERERDFKPRRNSTLTESGKKKQYQHVKIHRRESHQCFMAVYFSRRILTNITLLYELKIWKLKRMCTIQNLVINRALKPERMYHNLERNGRSRDKLGSLVTRSVSSAATISMDEAASGSSATEVLQSGI